MTTVLVSLFISLLLVVGLLLLSCYLIFDLWISVIGAPFVPTKTNIVEEILKRAKLKKGVRFLDLGSGDGRVLRFAVREYGVEGTGVELHPLLLLYAKIKDQNAKLKPYFIRKNFFDVSFKNYDVIFMFLIPKTVERLKEKFKKEFKGKLIISHGFAFKGWEKYLVDKIPRKTFSTYYYKITLR